jgi:hypothetical protein
MLPVHPTMSCSCEAERAAMPENMDVWPGRGLRDHLEALSDTGPSRSGGDDECSDVESGVRGEPGGVGCLLGRCSLWERVATRGRWGQR